MQSIYLDSNATSRPADEVTAAMQQMLCEHWGNPSSGHRFGQLARQRLELAREQVANLIGARPREITFLSGGTESANLAIRGVLQVALQHDPENWPTLLTTSIEHAAVREQAESLQQRGDVKVVWLTGEDGLVTPEVLTGALQSEPGAAIVSIQWTNNETGLIQPIAELGQVCNEHEVTFHVDGTQWVGKMPTDLSDHGALPVDLLTFSAHKFHGPKGVGCLWARRGIGLKAQQIGGSQERKRRPGTENAPAIVGIGVAAELSLAWLKTGSWRACAARRDRFEQALLSSCAAASVNCSEKDRLWSTSSIAFRGLEAEAILIALSERGVYTSAGAACSSGSLEPSPILRAMGIDDENAHGSVRFSISRETTDDEIDRAVDIIADVIRKLSA